MRKQAIDYKKLFAIDMFRHKQLLLKVCKELLKLNHQGLEIQFSGVWPAMCNPQHGKNKNKTTPSNRKTKGLEM
jgi:hypothetical protein